MFESTVFMANDAEHRGAGHSVTPQENSTTAAQAERRKRSVQDPGYLSVVADKNQHFSQGFLQKNLNECQSA